jgi:hypothetical protein
MVSPQQNAQMLCVIDANPIKEDTAKWSRTSGYDKVDSTRMEFVRVKNTFYLTVLNVTEKDAGEFTCTVKNGIGKEVKNKTYLLVKRKSETMYQTKNVLIRFILCIHLLHKIYIFGFNEHS